MAAQRKLELLISIVTRNRKELDDLIRQLNALNKAGKGFQGPEFDNFAKELGRAKNELSSIEGQLKSSRDGAGKTALNVTAIATSFGAVTQAVTLAAQTAQRFYSQTIGANERLNQQILASASSLAATQDIFSGGVKIEDPTQAIEQLQGPLKDAIKNLETETRDLVGVTSQEVNEVFSIILQNTGRIANQSEKTNDVFESTVDLSKSFVASLGTIGIPLSMARQEINSILQGQIDNNSALALNLGINSKMVEEWRSQGVLVDKLNEKLSAYVAGNALAADSIGGVSSNIQDIFEVVARNSTEPLLEPIVDGLKGVFDFLDQNQSDIETFFTGITQEVVTVSEEIGDNLGPALDSLLELFATALPLAKDLFSLALTGIEAVSRLAAPLIRLLADELNELFETTQKIVNAIQFRQAADAAEAIDVLAQSTQVLANEAERYISKIEELQAKQREQGQLSEEDSARLAQYQQLLADVQGEIDNQIGSIRGVSGAQGEAAEKQKELIAGLEDLRDATGESTQGVETQTKELETLGNAYDQLAEKAASARATVVAGKGDLTALEKAATDLTKLTSQRFELGQIDESEALASLQSVAQNQKLSADAQIAAAAEIRKVRENASQQRLADIQTELAATEAQLASELRTNVDAVQKVNKLRTQALQERARANQAAIQQEQQLIASGTGSQRVLQQLKQQSAALETEAVKLARESEKSVQAARIAAIDDASQDIKKIQLERNRQTYLLEARLNQQRATDAKLTEKDIQNELAKVRAGNNKARINEDIKLQKQRIAIFKDGSRDQRAAIIELQQLEIQRIEAVQSAEKVAKEISVDAIQDQIDRTRILQDSEKSRLDLREKAEARIQSSLSDQLSLVKSQNDTARAISSLREQLAGAELDDTREALQLRRELDSENISDERKQEIENRLKVLGEVKTTEEDLEQQLLEAQRQRNIEQFNALQAKQAAEKQELQFQLQLQQLDASRETAREQARQRELEFQRTLLELERSKAEADGNAAGVEAADRGLGQLDAAIADQEQATAASQKKEGLIAQTGSNQLRALEARQAGEDVELFRRLRDEVSGLAKDLGDSKVGDKAQELAEKIGRNAEVVEKQARQTAQKLKGEITQNGDSSSSEGRLTNAERTAKEELEKSGGADSSGFEGALINEVSAATHAVQAALSTLDKIAAKIPEQPIPVTIAKDTNPDSAPDAESGQNIPSLDVGGVMPAGIAMVHSGELIAPGVSTEASARARLAAGDGYMIQRSGLVQSATGGYVFTAQKSQQLISGLAQPPTLPLGGVNMPIPLGGGSLVGVDLGELSGLSGAQLNELRSLNRNINQVLGQGKSEARMNRHQRYRK